MNLIAKIRIQNGLTQSQFAKKIGAKTAQTISNIENGKATLHKRYLKMITKNFGADIKNKIIRHRLKEIKIELEKAAI